MTLVSPSPAPATAPPADQGVLLVQGSDRPGLVAEISGILAGAGANIVSLDQFSDDPDGGHFFQRTVFHLDDLPARRPELSATLGEQLDGWAGLDWRLSETGRPKRVAVLASKADHCLLELLWRHRRGEMPMTVPMVISNHPTLAEDVRQFGVPFFHVPSTGSDKSPAETEILRLLRGNVDLVVLARYMQILSASFLEEVGVPVINIHHSFLPAFVGADPYRRAKERGVKLVGATAHYVTEDLDEGPIIEQDVVRVGHGDSADAYRTKGADVERLVLARAVAWHCEDRVMRHGTETVVFR